MLKEYLWVLIFLGLVLTTATGVFAADTVGSLKDSAAMGASVQIASLPLVFIPNEGQYDPQVAYAVTGPESFLYFTPGEIVIVRDEPAGNGSLTHVVRQTFPGASDDPAIMGTDPLPGTANFFTGNDSAKWQTGIATYGAVEYRDLYPGIDLRYTGTTGTLKREFTVAPGADASAIKLQYTGADRIAIDGTGALVVTTGNSTLNESPLVSYQDIRGARSPVTASYHIINDHEVMFDLGMYDPAYPLVIDPALVYSTYLGGNSNDRGSSIAVDGSGNAYVTGYTASTNFPITSGSLNGPSDAFVTKLNPDGTSFVYSTYLGGNDIDHGNSIAVDGSGNTYVTGYTKSPDFPTTPGAFNSTFGGNQDAFVTKLNPAGSGLVYSTYVGGKNDNQGNSIAVDGNGNTYVTGYTASPDFPTTPGAFNSTFGGNQDAFVTKLNPAGSGLVYSTYVGGNDIDHGNSIAVDGSGNAYVTGYTASPDFPTTPGAFNRIFRGTGWSDAFVTGLNPAGSGLVYSTYLGGKNDDHGNSIAVDGSGNAYVTGYTASPDFPTTPGAFNVTFGGGNYYDAFVTKMNPSGAALVYSTYLGGASTDTGYSIVVDGSGNAYVTGSTFSSDFPTTSNAYNRTLGGNQDAFVTKLNPAGSGPVYSTYLGGSQYDVGEGIAVDGSGNTYVTGYTASPNFPTTAGAYNRTFGGGEDAYFARFSFATPSPADNGGSGGDSSGEGVGGQSVAVSHGVTAGQPVMFSFDQSPSTAAPIALDSVAITFTHSISEVDLVGLPSTTSGSIPDDTIIGFFQIEPTGLNENYIGQGVISFAVDATWLTEHHIEPSHVVMLRNHDNQWTELPTTFVSQSGSTCYYTAATPGFSYFAVAARSSTAAVNTTATVTGTASSVAIVSETPSAEVTTATTTIVTTKPRPASTSRTPVTTSTTAVPLAGTNTGGSSGIPVLTILAGIGGIAVLAVGGVLVRRWWIHRQNPALFKRYD